MAEAVHEKIESGHGPQSTDTDHGHGHVFEPEVLAFAVSIEPIVPRTWQVR